MKHSEDGFTLIELLLGIVCAALLMIAAGSYMVVCLRMEETSQTLAYRQETVGITFTLIERLLENGCTFQGDQEGGESWSLVRSDDSDSPAALTYQEKNGEGALYIGDAGTGTLILSGEFKAGWMDDAKGVLAFSYTDADDVTYQTAVYCRTEATPSEPAEAMILQNVGAESLTGENLSAFQIPEDVPEGCRQFLKVLLGEEGSYGQIRNGSGESYSFYSEWYLGGYERNPQWSSATPWCSCFVSWALAQVQDTAFADGRSVPRFAEVPDGMFWFASRGAWAEADSVPNVGDLIFFDVDRDGVADHVGVVLSAEDGAVCTIEGNRDGMVSRETYSCEEASIMGYGRLEWKAE